MDYDFLDSINKKRNYYFDFYYSNKIKYHYYEIFRQMIQRLDFINLDDILSIRELKKKNYIGSYYFYIGGLYGKTPYVMGTL